MDILKKENLEDYLKLCKLELEKKPGKEYIEIEIGDLLQKSTSEEDTDLIIASLAKKLLELELYITDGHYKLTENPARYSKRIRDLEKDDLVRIYNY